MIIKLFSPHYTSGQDLTADTTSATANLTAVDEDFRIVNESDNPIYIRTYPSTSGTIDATTSDLKVPGNDVFYGRKDETHDRISYIAPAGSSAFNIITGLGL